MTKQVIVMRTDLNMRKGKMIAQGAHASMAFLLNGLQYDIPSKKEYVTAEINLRKNVIEWAEHGQTKICVRVDSEKELLEIYKAADIAGLEVHIITDSGRTEFGGVPTRTCLAIGPNKSEEIDKITGHLKLL